MTTDNEWTKINGYSTNCAPNSISIHFDWKKRKKATKTFILAKRHQWNNITRIEHIAHPKNKKMSNRHRRDCMKWALKWANGVCIVQSACVSKSLFCTRTTVVCIWLSVGRSFISFISLCYLFYCHLLLLLFVLFFIYFIYLFFICFFGFCIIVSISHLTPAKMNIRMKYVCVIWETIQTYLWPSREILTDM